MKELVCISADIEIIEQQLKQLQTKQDLGIIKLSDALTEYDELSKKEKALRERFVMKVHVTLGGQPRKIEFHAATDKNPEEYWYTLLPDGRRKKSRSRENLILLLYDHYTGASSDYTVSAVFKAALHEKEITENPKKETIRRDKFNYKRFINSELASTDIRKVTNFYLKEYTQRWVNAEHPKKSVYLSYKGILNLIFKYATSHRMISVNPVKSINNKVYIKSCDTRKPRPDEKILSPDEIEGLKAEVRRRMTMTKYGRYYINGFALLFSIETGVRIAELCAMKWEDIYEGRIHIHRQQLSESNGTGNKTYYLVDYTKNEKGISEDGRDFPLTDAIASLLSEIRTLQEELGIDSEFIFCHEDGEWIKKDAYATFLRRICDRFGFKVRNNHALRMSLNSNVLIPLEISAADRAAMLGHSIETNLKFYSFAKKGYLEDVRNRLNTGFADPEVSRDTSGTPKIVPFSQKKKAQNH